MSTTCASLTLVLQTGPQQGKELRLGAGEELILGRGRDAHLVIDDAKASRRHARIAPAGAELCIEDLGSINGTFVNGNRITARTVLFPGDAIEVANLRLRVEEWNQPSGDTSAFSGPLPDKPKTANVATMGNVLSDTLTPAKLREMLKFLTQRQKTGALVIHAVWGTGKIHFRDGKACHASIAGSPSINPRKAIQRLLRAQSGSLEFSVDDPIETKDQIKATLGELLQESADFPEQFARLEKLIPALDARLVVASSSAIADYTLTAHEIEILRLTRKQGTLAHVMDEFSGSDTEAVRLLISLTEKGQIQCSR